MKSTSESLSHPETSYGRAAGGNCVVVRRGGEQPEADLRSQTKVSPILLKTGQEMVDRLELITNPSGTLGWNLATKVPLRDAARKIIGIASISRDLSTPSEEDVKFAGVGRVVSHIRGNLDEELRPPFLAAIAGLSPSQLERRMKRVFQLTTSKFTRKAWIEHAAQLLATGSLPVVEIALRCGYGDQTSFTRQFRATVGLPPAAFRERARKGS